MRAFAEALEIIPYTLAENAGLHPIGIVTELRNAHAQGRRHDGALFIMLCTARERGCKRGLGQCAVCVLQGQRHGGALQSSRRLGCKAMLPPGMAGCIAVAAITMQWARQHAVVAVLFSRSACMHGRRVMSTPV